MGYSIPKQNVISYGPKALSSFHGYIFEWIDNLHFTQAPSAFVGPQAAAYIAVAKERFLEMGWEGDGDVQLLWIPASGPRDWRYGMSNKKRMGFPSFFRR